MSPACWGEIGGVRLTAARKLVTFEERLAEQEAGEYAEEHGSEYLGGATLFISADATNSEPQVNQPTPRGRLRPPLR
jgi:hypothetical protein